MSNDYLKLQLLSRVHPRTTFYGVLHEKTRPEKSQSPYYPDREASRANSIKGSQEEVAWKKVANSREQMLEQIKQGEIKDCALSEHNLKKMRII